MTVFKVPSDYKNYVVCQGERYWPNGRDYILGLPVPSVTTLSEQITSTPNLVEVELPEWAIDISVDKSLLVPDVSITDISGDTLWEKVDWFFVLFWFLSGVSEWCVEQKKGPIHSYSFNLKTWDERVWQRAWGNRICLFLRRWSARIEGKGEVDLLGPLPSCKIHLTHDVDAISKTLPIRIKQSVFHIYNALKCLTKNERDLTFNHLSKAMKFMLLPGDYWCFEQIQHLEERFQQRSVFNFFAGKRNFSLKRWLFNPGYDVSSEKLAHKISELRQKGWRIGLHQGFESWSSSEDMLHEKASLEQSFGDKISECRQHWLRFSWNKTWKAQEKVGLEIDSTLAFNDRPGFRTSTALCYHPWDFSTEKQLEIETLPTVFMDSHFYDYRSLTHSEVKKEIAYWINEIKEVHGEAAVIWHQRVFSNDYGWGSGYELVLKEIRGNSDNE